MMITETSFTRNKEELIQAIENYLDTVNNIQFADVTDSEKFAELTIANRNSVRANMLFMNILIQHQTPVLGKQMVDLY